jgi:diguanylate cyclase (GGDEF)-like protein/putative nucleotidyltransferase with HDIG domain
MQSLPLAVRIYVGLVITAGAVLLVVLGPRATFQDPLLFAVLLLLSAITSAFKVSLPLDNSGSTMSISYAVDFAALILLGPHETMLISVASAWSQCTFRMKAKNPVYRTLFSMAVLAITVQVSGWVFLALGGVPGVLGSVPQIAKPLVGAATAYFVCNTLLIAVAIGLSARQSILAVWNQNFLWSAPSYFVGAAVAVAAEWALLGSGIWVALLLAAPLYLTYRTYKVYLGRIDDERRHVQEMADLHLATIEALALAIDAKDQTAQSHIRRVQAYAAAIARTLGMPDSEIQGVKTAALLHDIGKLAVPEHILSKPGPLTQEEFQKIRIHPQVGAEIISAVPFPYPVAPLILSHHERWDGKGYPQGLKGEEIPVGARILSVVDYFDALTSDRPYHKAMTHDAAIALLQQESGKALDPNLVRLFILLLPTLSAEAQLENAPGRRLSLESNSDRGRPAVGFQPEGAKGTTVFEDIAQAHREIYALYEIAQSLGTSLGVADTMSLVSSKLSSLVPFTSCALFLIDEDTDTLRCAFATGLEAEVISTMTVRSGQGLTGWVARNRRPLVNARPSADFEAAGLTTRPTALQSALVAPLVFNDLFIGTLAVYHSTGDFYTDDHRRLLDRVSDQAAAVIHNSSVFEQTQEDSLTDALTGLPNTRFMFMHLTRELARAERLKSEVALLVMDLDKFKDINDSHGHHVGDLALREVAAVLRSAIRPYDICIRYAGDEFIVVLSGCGQEEAERKRIELQQAVDRIEFEVRPGRRVPLALSVGAAIFPHDGDRYEALLAAADSRMYRDKSRRKQPRLHIVATGTDGPGAAMPQRDSRGEPTDVEIQRAGVGLL